MGSGTMCNETVQAPCVLCLYSLNKGVGIHSGVPDVDDVNGIFRFFWLTSLYYLRALYTKGLEPVRLVLLTSL